MQIKAIYKTEIQNLDEESVERGRRLIICAPKREKNAIKDVLTADQLLLEPLAICSVIENILMCVKGATAAF